MSYGSLNSLIFNPVGPTFSGTGNLNPFSDRKIREAVNWLLDRQYIAEEIMGGMAVPKWLPVVSAFPDYSRYVDIARSIEAKYAYNPETAKAQITTEMEGLGAKLVDGKWQYNGEPVELIFLIRTEDERRDIGDYVAGQLESVGFTVVRDYKTSAEAAPIYNQGDPNLGKWHLYTAGWVNNWVERDSSNNFDAYYTPRGQPTNLWAALKPSPEFDKLADRINRADYKTMDERRELFKQGFELAMQDSAEVFLVDRRSFTARAKNVETSYDLASAVAGSSIWPYTLRRKGEIGGAMTIAEPSILTEPWNPIAGTNWLYDASIYRATADQGVMPDPHTGLRLPHRVDSAVVTVKEGLPVNQTLDWCKLEFAPQITVPADAWIDWDGANQKFITVGEKYPNGVTANVRVRTTFQKGLKDLKWHDGSKFSVADIVMAIIMNMDPGKKDSALYDESQAPAVESLLAHHKGTRIVSTDPIVVEFYSDQIQLDAELIVGNNYMFATWFPYYTYGPGAWHNIAVGVLAETAKEAAFSSDKADNLKVDQMSFIAGPTLEILKKHMDKAAAENYIPFKNVLGQFISADEAKARWANLESWYKRKGHIWLGTGPYYLEKAFPVEGTVILKHNPDYPDPANRYERFGTPKIADVELDGPGRVAANTEAKFDVLVTFNGQPYLKSDVAEVKYLVFDAKGAVAAAGVATPIEDGQWQIVLPADVTGKLEAGSNRLEVAVISKLVSLPGMAAQEFVSTP